MAASTNGAPPIIRLNNGRPIVQQVTGHPWENRVTFNPACALVSDPAELSKIIPSLPFDEATKQRFRSQKALCFLLYRAQGEKRSEYDHTRSSIGLAVLSPELHLLARHTTPVLMPDNDFEDLGVEDGRITKAGDRYYMFYCAYSSHPEGNRIRLAVASTQNFVEWQKHGLLKGRFNALHNKNSMLFDGMVNGAYALLHRPMEGPQAMSIHWATSKDVLGPWQDQGLLMAPQPNPAFKDTWIGGGAPPLRLPDGRYLLLYHIGNRKHDGSREYDLGIAIADFNKPGIIVKRIEPLLRPESPAETQGDATLGVNNVVFICGAYFYEGDLYFPYAGADSVVLGGKIAGSDLQAFLRP
jgi:beta-1,2-mannobiose phosphorylase / 1,2-beta-oligomannan phosphorylase